MQPKSNTLNLILFAILSFIILVGWQLLQRWLSPPPKNTIPIRPEVWSDMAVRSGALSIGPGVPGLGDAIQNAANLRIAKYLGDWNYHPPAAVAQEPKKPPQPVAEIKPQAPSGERKTFWLGDDSRYYLRVKVTSLGAGVESVFLNQFEAATAIMRRHCGADVFASPSAWQRASPLTHHRR